MKYYLANPIAKGGLDRFPETFSRTEELAEANILLVRSAVLHETEFPNTLYAIGRAGAGVNNIPLDRAAKEGIVVFNSPGANSNAVKELTLLGLLLASRDAKGGMGWIEENREDENLAKSMEKAKARFAGTEIAGKTLGVVGLGAIGYKIANAALALGMKVVGYDPFLTVPAALHLSDEVEIVTDLADLYAVSDYVTLHVPENPATKGMISRTAIAEMRDGAALLNFARPGLVDEDALEEALTSGKIRKYVTDVPNFRTANLPNVIAFPHLGASTEEAEDASAIMAVDEILDYLENGNIRNSVNFPAVDLGKKNGLRVSILFEDAPGLAEKIAEILAPAGILKCETKTRKGFGAALFELKNAPAQELHKLEGLLRVRILE